MKKHFTIFAILSIINTLQGQITTWQSSEPTIVSVNVNGIAKLETTNTGGIQFVTITSTTTQNSKVTKSEKQIEVNPYYPGCSAPSVYVNGIWWAGCNAQNYVVYSSASCASGWRLPTKSEISILYTITSTLTNCSSTICGRLFENGLWFPNYGEYVNGAFSNLNISFIWYTTPSGYTSVTSKAYDDNPSYWGLSTRCVR